jgi:hypothetical protein
MSGMASTDFLRHGILPPMDIKQKRNDELSDKEIANRRDAALLRALSTPHKRQTEMKVGKRQNSKDGDQKMAAKR